MHRPLIRVICLVLNVFMFFFQDIKDPVHYKCQPLNRSRYSSDKKNIPDVGRRESVFSHVDLTLFF